MTNWITTGAGLVYLRLLQTDVANQETLTLADVQTSWILVIVAIAICLINSFAIPYLSWEQMRTR